MKKTMLTYRTLDKFETLINPETLTLEQIEKVEHFAYCANMGAKGTTCEEVEESAWVWFCHLLNEFMGISLKS